MLPEPEEQRLTLYNWVKVGKLLYCRAQMVLLTIYHSSAGRKPLQMHWILLKLLLAFEVPDLSLQHPLSTWSFLAVNVGHVRKCNADCPHTFQGIADCFAFNLHQAIYLWFFIPKYSVVKIWYVCKLWIVEFCLSVTWLFVLFQDCLLWKTICSALACLY